MSQPLLSTAELILLREQARYLLRPAAARTLSLLAGPHPSRNRGQGLEAEDIRPYQSGDDIRHVDWRATARAGRPYSRVFREERLQLRLLAVDRHAGMNFGTQGALKAAVAARVAALLGFATLATQGSIAGMTLETPPHYFAPGRSENGLLVLLGAIARPLPETGAALPPHTVLDQIAAAAPKRAEIVIISDCHGWHETAALTPRLAQLTARHALHVIQVIDAGEQQLPALGRLRLASPYSGATTVIDSNDAQLRQRYAATMSQRQQAISELLQRHGVTHQRVYTAQDTWRQLLSAA